MGKVRKRVCGRRRSGNLGNPLFSNSCPGKISSGQCVQMSSTANKTICPDDFCSSKMDQNLIRKLTKNDKIKSISSKLAIVGGRGQCTCVKSKHFLLHLLYGPHTATRVIMIPLLAYCHHMSRRCIAPQQQHLGTVRSLCVSHAGPSLTMIESATNLHHSRITIRASCLEIGNGTVAIRLENVLRTARLCGIIPRLLVMPMRLALH